MSFRRVGWVAAIALATLLEISCGQVYRPVVIPISITPPNPANFHAVFSINANVPFNPGHGARRSTSPEIRNIGTVNVGVNPTHAAILPNNSRVFVASAGSMFKGDTDLVTAFFPAGDSSSRDRTGQRRRLLRCRTSALLIPAPISPFFALTFLILLQPRKPQTFM